MKKESQRRNEKKRDQQKRRKGCSDRVEGGRGKKIEVVGGKRWRELCSNFF